jgi:putative ATPase
MEDVREGRTIPVPVHLKDTHYKGSKRLGHGKGYQYAHDHPGGYVEQDYLGVEKRYYEPTDHGHEAQIQSRLNELRARKERKTGDAGEEEKSEG